MANIRENTVSKSAADSERSHKQAVYLHFWIILTPCYRGKRVLAISYAIISRQHRQAFLSSKLLPRNKVTRELLLDINI